MTQSALTIWQQGQGAVPAPWLNRSAQNVDNVAALRAAPGINGMVCWIQGTATQNDGGQGMFAWNSASTAPDDNGVTTVVPNGYSVGAWLRQPPSSGSIAPGSITYSQIQNESAGTLLGNLSASAASPSEQSSTAVTAFLNYATTMLQGAIQLATNAQAIAGSSTTLAITPATLAAVLAAATFGITLTGSNTFNAPSASAAAGTVGSQGTITLGGGSTTLKINWGVVQFEDYNAQTATSWGFPTAFVNNPLIAINSCCGAIAGQGANANRGVLALNALSTTSSSWILRDTAATSTLAAFMLMVIGT